MNCRKTSEKLEIIALLSSVIGFIVGLCTNVLMLNAWAVPLFWLLMLLSAIAAMLSFRWKALFALFLIPVSIVGAGWGLPYSYHSTHSSPDGEYRLVVYSRMQPLAFPGQGSDAPGHIQLQNKSGQVKGAIDVDMVQQVYNTQWHEDKVSIGLNGEIALP